MSSTTLSTNPLAQSNQEGAYYGICLYKGLLAPQLDSEAPSLGRYDFNMLPASSKELDSLWGNIALRRKGNSADIVFSGCNTGIGTSFVAFHLAVLVAREYGVRVLYVETNVADSRHRSIVDFEGRPGLISYFTDSLDMAELAHATREPNLFVMGTGHGHAQTHVGSLLLQSERLRTLMETARNSFDVVIYDCAPVVSSPWSIAFAKNSAGVILVCGYANSRREVCKVTLERLAANDAPVLGAILNNRSYPIPIKVYDWLK